MLLSFCINLCSLVTSASLSRILLFQRCFWSPWVFLVTSKLIIYSNGFYFYKNVGMLRQWMFNNTHEERLYPHLKIIVKRKIRCVNTKYLFVPLSQTRRARRLKGCWWGSCLIFTVFISSCLGWESQYECLWCGFTMNDQSSVSG